MKNLIENRLSLEVSQFNHPEKDVVIKDDYHVKNWEFLLLAFSIFSYVIDVIFDINLAVNFYKHGELTYATLTILFVLFPSFITIGVSLSWDILDEEAKSLNTSQTQQRRSRACWCCRIIVMVLQLAPVLRYVDSLYHAWQCRQAEKDHRYEEQRNYYKMMLKRDADAAFLRVLECLLESAPQLVLQMTIIMIQTSNMEFHELFSSFSLSQAPQALSIITSLISIAWSMASYQRSTRIAQDDKQNISHAGSMLQFTWHILIAVSRILSISVLASIYSLYTGTITLVHSIFMAVWLFIWRPPDCCRHYSPFWKAVYCFIVGLVHIFVYLSTTDGPNRKFYLLYYAVFFVENVSMLTVYGFYFSGIEKPWYFSPVMVGAALSFFAGIISMLVYYGWFHPTTDVRCNGSMRQDNSTSAFTNHNNTNELTEIDLQSDDDRNDDSLIEHVKV